MQNPTNFPYIRHEPSEADNSSEYTGGSVVAFTAAATLLVGDVVFLSAASTVDKSTTAANYLAFMGVVVGGDSTFGQCCGNDSDVGITAALVNKKVFVQVSGVAWVLAAAAVAVATPLEVATTAGQVDDVATPTAGEQVGTAITAATNAGDKILMLIDHR